MYFNKCIAIGSCVLVLLAGCSRRDVRQIHVRLNHQDELRAISVERALRRELGVAVRDYSYSFYTDRGYGILVIYYVSDNLPDPDIVNDLHSSEASQIVEFKIE